MLSIGATEPDDNDLAYEYAYQKLLERKLLEDAAANRAKEKEALDAITKQLKAAIRRQEEVEWAKQQALNEPPLSPARLFQQRLTKEVTTLFEHHTTLVEQLTATYGRLLDCIPIKDLSTEAFSDASLAEATSTSDDKSVAQATHLLGLIHRITKDIQTAEETNTSLSTSIQEAQTKLTIHKLAHPPQ